MSKKRIINTFMYIINAKWSKILLKKLQLT